MRRILTKGDRLHFDGNYGTKIVSETFNRRDLVRVTDEDGIDKGVFEIVGEPWVLLPEADIKIGDNVQILMSKYIGTVIDERDGLALIDPNFIVAPGEQPQTFWISKGKIVKAERLNP